MAASFRIGLGAILKGRERGRKLVTSRAKTAAN